jgi:branched-chain amino acid transport system substrate-binding protein
MSSRKIWPYAILCLALALALVMAGGLGTPAFAKGKITVGLMYDTTGPTQLHGIVLSGAGRDYFQYVNHTGGVKGHPLKVIEHEMGYKVPLAVEAYERFRQAGAVYYPAYGTPIIYALTERTTKDQIPTTSPGFGRADASDGRRFPYIFPIAATYWSQAGASIKFVVDSFKAEGGKGMPKIAYLYYDNPAGREPLPMFKSLKKKLGFTFKSWAIPPPGVEMSAQILDILHRYKPDWVIAHIFGKGPSISIKEFQRNGFPLDHVLSFVWGCVDQDINAAGWDVAEGYLGMQFAGSGMDYPVIKGIQDMYKKAGKKLPTNMTELTIEYNRGVLWTAVPVEAIKLAVEKYGYPVTGKQVRDGFEMIKNFSLGGILPPMTITPSDHEGGGFVQVTQVKGGKWSLKKDWFRGYRDDVLAQIAEAAKGKH